MVGLCAIGVATSLRELAVVIRVPSVHRNYELMLIVGASDDLGRVARPFDGRQQQVISSEMIEITISNSINVNARRVVSIA